MNDMGSESDEVLIEDSDDSSVLDIREINDLEYDIPSVAPPSLESVLWDMESEDGGSDNASLHSVHSLSQKFRSMLYHCILQGISSQIISAGEKVNAGSPSVITNSFKFVSIGTSHGYVLTFDAEQKLCWYCYDPVTADQGAIAALAFNVDSTRLLIGYERGYVSMIDAVNGDILRRLPDAHAPQSAVLHLRFTALNNLALCGDSAGCVFSLMFNRRLGIRTWDSKCLFSGARGEVCIFEPLIQGQDIHYIGQNILVAMATLSKIIVITIKPRLRVIFSQQLPRAPTSLPLISWQIVTVGKTIQPVLAWGRGSELNYSRLTTAGLSRNKLRLTPLRCVQLPYTLCAMHWIGSRHLGILDTSENIRLIEVRTQHELETLELANVGLVYSSAHFKALAVGGGVSEAFALAGEHACYNSLSSRGDQMLILGTKAVHLVKLRSWPERLIYLSEQGRWTEALNLAAKEGQYREKSTAVLLEKYLNSLGHSSIDRDTLTAAVNCCVKLNKIDLLCNDLWESILQDEVILNWYYTLLSDHICNGSLYFLNPSVAKALVSYLELRDTQTLENVLLSLDLSCLDLHQVLKICRSRKLYDAWIHITTKTMGDYTSPLIEYLDELTLENHRLGNTMLVYVSSCLRGLGYPNGKIPDRDVPRAKHDVLRCLETVHSVTADENEPVYPYLRALLKYNTRECLNVVELTFTEAEFSGDLGLLQRHRLIKILFLIVTPPEFNDSQIISLACFVSHLVTSNNLNVEEDLLDAVIKSLTDMAGKPLSFRDHMEREQAWLDLLSANKLKHLGLTELLRMALDSKCYRVAEAIYEIQKDFSNILTCYLEDKVRCAEVFNYILRHVDSGERVIKEQFLANFKQLVQIDCKKTADIVVEFFPESIQLFYNILSDVDLYLFLTEVVSSDLKLPPNVAEHYLELLSQKNPALVDSYLQLKMCHIEKALEITRKYALHSGSALLLEQEGNIREALDLLLKHDIQQQAVELCIRGTEHVDAKGAQELWLTLLKHPTSLGRMSLRQLLHAAAPHLPPGQLLEFVTDASLGDVKTLIQDMLMDCVHDKEILVSTLKLLGSDLHHGLARALCVHGRGLSMKNTCSMCQSPLVSNKTAVIKNQDDVVAAWGCGHCFHTACVSCSEDLTSCPVCRTTGTALFNYPPSTPNKTRQASSTVKFRPDLEGHF